MITFLMWTHFFRQFLQLRCVKILTQIISNSITFCTKKMKHLTPNLNITIRSCGITLLVWKPNLISNFGNCVLWKYHLEIHARRTYLFYGKSFSLILNFVAKISELISWNRDFDQWKCIILPIEHILKLSLLTFEKLIFNLQRNILGSFNFENQAFILISRNHAENFN